jgi:hypothetical protein
LAALALQVRVPYRTYLRWWQLFCHATGRTLRPMQATAEDREAFFDWLEASSWQDQATRDAQKALTMLRRLAQTYDATWLVEQVLRPAEAEARAHETARKAEVLRHLRER